MKNKKQAFTLAEVLLVLAIIGVIAAVTIPAVMQQSSEKKFSALAKKAQSSIQNAINLKIATVPIGPGDMRVGLFQWLLDGEDDGTNTLKVAKASANFRAIQLPDGIILYQTLGNCTDPTTRTNLLGCAANYIIRIDLNGSEGPNKTTIDNASTELAGFTGAKDYDIINVYVDNDGKVRSWGGTFNGATAETKRTVKYLGFEHKS
ncbi:type II secretion system protein [bacterium]|nr:type II secretion system protein [bacterium]